MGELNWAELLGRWLSEPSRERSWKSHGNDRDGYWAHLYDEPTFPHGAYSGFGPTLETAVLRVLELVGATASARRGKP